MKGEANLSRKDEKALKANSTGRKLEKVGGKIASATDKVAGYLASSNFVTNTINLADSLSPVPFLNPLIVAGLLNNVIGVVGEGIEAYGGYVIRSAAFGGHLEVCQM